MSWLRAVGGGRGLVLLTVGDEVYAGDPRLRVERPVLSMVSNHLIPSHRHNNALWLPQVWIALDSFIFLKELHYASTII